MILAGGAGRITAYLDQFCFSVSWAVVETGFRISPQNDGPCAAASQLGPTTRRDQAVFDCGV
jgi:hypothetical protein